MATSTTVAAVAATHCCGFFDRCTFLPSIGEAKLGYPTRTRTRTLLFSPQPQNRWLCGWPSASADRSSSCTLFSLDPICVAAAGCLLRENRPHKNLYWSSMVMQHRVRSGVPSLLHVFFCIFSRHLFFSSFITFVALATQVSRS